MTKSVQLSSSLEDYLEAIYNIVSDKGGVRAKDIAAYLKVKAGSVTTALQALAKGGFVNYQPYEVITLTDKGLETAQRIIRKHEILKDFFVDILGADPATAEIGACKMEHGIGDELVERLISFTEFLQACPRCKNDWLSRFHQRCGKEIPHNIEDCKTCIRTSIDNLKKEDTKISSKTTLMTLQDVPVGYKCIVKKINKKGSATQRLVEMGISRGTIIEVERVAPLGDPVEIKVKGYHLSIRKEEAVNIHVEQQ